jgi:hypothetical protein
MPATFPISEAAHHELHARATQIGELVAALGGDRGAIVDALAYLVGYESAAAGLNLPDAAAHAMRLIRLGAESAHPAYLLAHT